MAFFEVSGHYFAYFGGFTYPNPQPGDLKENQTRLPGPSDLQTLNQTLKSLGFSGPSLSILGAVISASMLIIAESYH